jgi:hypothetical protein
VLGEDPLPVRHDVEDAVVALDELRLDAEFLLDRGRQTGGPGQVVSAYAVGDRDLHGRPLEFGLQRVAARAISSAP